MKRLKNKYQDLLEFIRRYIFIVSPLVSFIIFIFFKHNILNSIQNNNEYIGHVINLSGIFAGFLFTAFSILMAIPDNKFMSLLKESGYLAVIFKVLLFGISFLLISMLLGLFVNNKELVTIFFLFGISETIVSVYYFYLILHYSSLSK